MANKGPIYKEKGIVANSELLAQLQVAVKELEVRMVADVQVFRGGHDAGWGVGKAQRGIAVDAVISIARVIKGLKGW
ncbi:hypothetical protein LCGC14_0140740 [marine sediment metagenome]|uniref:Uncharacterized protein n=1 Tax=marine sediment metagenome TaxID=412755 RepID=A0A0F9Y2F6_9ZZZZ